MRWQWLPDQNRHSGENNVEADTVARADAARKWDVGHLSEDAATEKHRVLEEDRVDVSDQEIAAHPMCWAVRHLQWSIDGHPDGKHSNASFYRVLCTDGNEGDFTADKVMETKLLRETPQFVGDAPAHFAWAGSANSTRICRNWHTI